MVSREYAGDVSIGEAWEILKKEPKAQLVDVRTVAEWSFVGLPDLTPVGREVLCVEWQFFPATGTNPNFVAQTTEKLKQAGAGTETPLLFLCRSGGRSRNAAIAMTRAGYTNALNVAGGFEGDLDEILHRGKRNGWKAEGMPWRQS